MKQLSSFNLFEKNPHINTQFPFLILDVNHHQCYPPRLKFHEMHWHDDLQITLVISGEIEMKTIDQCLTLKENNIVFINKKVLHQITERDDAHYKSFLFPDAFMTFYDNSPMYNQVLHFLNNENLTVLPIHNQNLIKIIFQINELTSQKKDPYYEYQIILLINQFILELMKTTHLSTQSVHSHQNLCVQECITFIHNHYDEDITLEDIASFAHISVGYCGRLFKKGMQTTPYDYLIHYRIQKSLDLLASHQYTISQVARLVGFNSLSHYIQCFKKILQITPKQYQKSLFQSNQ